VTDKKGKGALVPEQSRATACWSPPEPGWCKINVDGACSTSGGEAGWGVIIRDHTGKVLLSAWRWIPGVVDAEEIETLACKEGLCLAAEWIQGPAVLESDCSTVIKYLTNPRLRRARTTFTIQEATKAAARLPRVTFKHIRRDQSQLAPRTGATG